ncbi:MAG: response regulator transcription factor [Dorea sp.]|jgi:DNA-binding LytR/AlgR family response regulator|nr:response regulator transcription factor [Dorea sp.]
MYFIGLCDDDERELDIIEDFLTAYLESKEMDEYGIDRFQSAEELLERISEKKYNPDLLLLDIFMSGKTGVEAAEELRRQQCGTFIVFLTTSKEYALEAYGVDALQYLVKPLDRERFFHAMEIVFQQMKKAEEQIVMKVAGGGIRQMKPDEIICCESQKNYQMLYLETEECRVRMTAKELWEMLEHFTQFRRCGRSYILNLNHVISVEKEEILMDNECRIFIPRNVSAEFKKVYFSYFFN